MFSKAKIQEMMAKFSKVNVADIQDASLRAQAVELKKKQSGFTLLELLVVVAILAAIAGTATIALQDTDARASAAAHVAMMDELNKGIRTFRVLNKNTLPSDFDSIIQTADSAAASMAAAELLEISEFAGEVEPLAVIQLSDDAAGILTGGGIENLRYVTNEAISPPDSTVSCADLEGVVASRSNAVVAGNIFLSPAASGCGYSAPVDSAAKVAIWTGGYERVMGEAGRGFDTATPATDNTAITGGATGAPVLMAVGLGPSSTLFNANDLGGMTTVPVYRHVDEVTYNRFIALFNIGTISTGAAATNGYISGDQVVLTTIVDGAGDTKEEELGEWDGTRNTI